jgi:hypothetical protein
VTLPTVRYVCVSLLASCNLQHRVGRSDPIIPCVQLTRTMYAAFFGAQAGAKPFGSSVRVRLPRLRVLAMCAVFHKLGLTIAGRMSHNCICSTAVACALAVSRRPGRCSHPGLFRSRHLCVPLGPSVSLRGVLRQHAKRACESFSTSPDPTFSAEVMRSRSCAGHVWLWCKLSVSIWCSASGDRDRAGAIHCCMPCRSCRGPG